MPYIVGHNNRVPESQKSSDQVSNLEMRVNIESTEPVWTVALEIKNPNQFPVPLNFLTGQQFDFLLEAQDPKQKLWQWSAGKSFNLNEKTTHWLEPGESKKYSVSFDPKSAIHSEKNLLSLKGVLHLFPQPLVAEAQVVYVDR